MISGRCLCQSVRFTITGRIGPAGFCHCAQCRRATGSAFASNATVRARDFRIDSGAELIREFESSPDKLRAFCSRCGSPLYSRKTSDPESRTIRLGTIDGDPGRKPLAHLWVESKAPWYDIEGELPCYAEGPDGRQIEEARRKDRRTTQPPAERDALRLEDPSLADVEFLEDRIYDFNRSATGIVDGRGLGVFLRDTTETLVAGAAGHTWGETCELRQVWVAESLRGQGVGRRLLEEAEAEAIRRGCRQLVLTTHSFQAPGFYEKLGFHVVSELPEYPRGHRQIVLRKRLR
jgi:GNAT superfamily N-acetyltransferase